MIPFSDFLAATIAASNAYNIPLFNIFTVMILPVQPIHKQN
jgi:hypothetical protein